MSSQVFWDGYGLGNSNTGVCRHALSLFSQLRKLGIAPAIIGLGSDHTGFAEAKIIPMNRAFGMSKIAWVLRTGTILRKLVPNLSRDQKVIYHGLSNFNVPLLRLPSNVFKILTVHDIIPFLDSKAVSPSYYLQISWLFPKALESAHRIICVSNWTRDTVAEKFPKHKEKIHVISNGFDKTVPSNRRQVQRKEHISLLCISRWEKYKRLWLLPEMMQMLPQAQLVLVTNERGRKYFEKVCIKAIASNRLKIVSNIESNFMESLFSQSDVLVQPSLWEGCCLPASEALCHGMPVVYCKGSGIEETVKQCGIGLDSHATSEEWAEAVLSAYNFRNTPSFLESLEKLLESKPTWTDSAIQLKELYNSL